MFVSGETLKKIGKDDAKVIVCHLGNGASISASIGGKCVDTSMGLTPLEGLDWWGQEAVTWIRLFCSSSATMRISM